ncbi:acetyl-CoA synthetase [Panacagrimonas perspica]|uniref:Acetyl-CoA synthetase n=1 Tax=Panacagrimonas perspica TaxID=381431 RepID=A0A4R7PD87_9GAMM|nr:AMP-binding protein [Panacagrimonas perspica]TDU31692.1 acetyl-CoA synthetase [Panacagrimonas perspica]THD03093.1 AMP-dependent synthetase [Panacagrimonas perspica]
MTTPSASLASFRAARDLLTASREDYAKACATFRWPQMEMFNWALDHFDDLALDNQQCALWIVDDSGAEVRRTFDELRAASNRAANFLRDLGIRRGDRVLVMLPNRVELWELMLAAIKLGAVLSPATMLLSEADLKDRIERGRMRAVVVDGSVLRKFDGIADDCVRVVCGTDPGGWTDYGRSATSLENFIPDGPTKPDDPCVLYFTSGTTSKPKMVLHTQRSYPVGHLSTLYWLGLAEGDVHLNISTPGWAKHAWSCFFVPWTVGATIFIYNQGRFDAARTLATLQRCRVTTLCAPPTAWRSLILEDLARFKMSLRELTSAGEPLNPEVIEQVKAAWGITIREGFGQTESTAMLGNPPGLPVRYGSMGRPLPGYQIETLDIEGNPASEGEVSVRMDPRPAGLMAGYAEDPERTRKALGGTHYGTADVASVDAEGYYWYVGRTDDVFKSSDYRISPFELESALLEHDAVAEAAVIESPDARRLFVPKACVVLKPGIIPDRAVARSILAFARSRLAPYQKIRVIQFCELPKTVSGKIRRAELRAEEAERRARDERAPAEFFETDFTD